MARRRRRFRFSFRRPRFRRFRRPRFRSRGIKWPLTGRRKVLGIPLFVILAGVFAYLFVRPVKNAINGLFKK